MYTPHTPGDIAEMLAVIGVSSLEELLRVPSELLPHGDFSLPQALPEQELIGHFTELAAMNAGAQMRSFLGAGAYRHYVPPVVGALAMRGEFLTSYTPYQAEVSQGYLQAIYEWQTYIALLTGLDIANASVYDGASALVEGVIMAIHATHRRSIVISRAVHPQYRAVLQTYARGVGYRVIEVAIGDDGRTDTADVLAHLGDDVAAVVMQSPNIFGSIDTPGDSCVEQIRASGAVLIGVVAEALSLAVLQEPALWGAEIAVGEAQSFGVPVSYGGPYLGFVAATQAHLRRMPGRLVGRSVDRNGRLAYTLTLQAREQHIRRERASSNICTNQAHCALLATIYLAAVGESGLRDIAVTNLRRRRELMEALTAISGVSLYFTSSTFNEVALRLPHDPQRVLAALAERGILGGVALNQWYPEYPQALLVTATEMTSESDIAAYATALREVLASLGEA